jgi:hypothetical protein
MPAFDTYKYIRTLRDAGFTEAQAEAQSSALLQVYDSYLARLATKDDLKTLENDVKVLGVNLGGRIDTLKSDLTGGMDTQKSDLTGSMEKTRSDLTGSMEKTRSDLTGNIDALRADLVGQIKRLDERLDGQAGLLRWATGSSLVGCTVLLIAGMAQVVKALS